MKDPFKMLGKGTGYNVSVKITDYTYYNQRRFLCEIKEKGLYGGRTFNESSISELLKTLKNELPRPKKLLKEPRKGEA